MNPARSLTVAFLFLGACRLASAQSPDASQLLREVQAKYASLQSYSDVGEARLALIMRTPGDGAQGAGDAPAEIPTKSFRIKLARFQMFSIAWAENGGAFKSKGALWSDGGYRHFKMGEIKAEPQSTEEGFGMATGVSGGVAQTVPSVFFNLQGNAISAMQGALLSGQESIDGEDCYVVKSHSEKIDRTLWISKTSKLIRQARADIFADPAQILMKMSDFDFKVGLEKLGKKVTDETVQEIQAMTASALKELGPVRSTFTIETHREIKIDMPMSPIDFREEPQALPAIDPAK